MIRSKRTMIFAFALAAALAVTGCGRKKESSDSEPGTAANSASAAEAAAKSASAVSTLEDAVIWNESDVESEEDVIIWNDSEADAVIADSGAESTDDAVIWNESQAESGDSAVVDGGEDGSAVVDDGSATAPGATTVPGEQKNEQFGDATDEQIVGEEANAARTPDNKADSDDRNDEHVFDASGTAPFAPEVTETPKPTTTPKPTATPKPTVTPRPTAAPESETDAVIVESEAESAAESTVGAVEESVAESVVESMEESAVESVVESVEESAIESVVESAEESVVESAAESVEESAAASEAESVEESVAEDVEQESLLEHVRGIRAFSMISGMRPDVMAGISWDETISKVEADVNGIDWDEEGTHQLRYLITAVDGRQELAEITVTINPDLDLYLYGMEGDAVVKVGGSFDPMAGITYSSEIASVSADASGLDTSRAGVYLVSYVLTAPSGRTQSTVRQVTVSDGTYAGFADNTAEAFGSYSTVTDLGLWRLTAYMDTPADQGPYVGQTASGAPLVAGRTVAVSAATCARLGLQFGDHLMIDGHIYVLEDHGGSAMNDQNWVDIFVDNPIDEYSDMFNRYSEVYLLR